MGEATISKISKPKQRVYTDDDRVSTLAALDVNAGNVSRTSEQTGVSRLTIRTWRDAALTAGEQLVTAVVTTEKPSRKPDWADLYGRAASLGARIINRNLRRYRTLDLKPSELRDVAVIAGIAVDKHLDYSQGRKTSQVNVDARSVNLTQLTDEQLARLSDGR